MASAEFRKLDIAGYKPSILRKAKSAEDTNYSIAVSLPIIYKDLLGDAFMTIYGDDTRRFIAHHFYIPVDSLKVLTHIKRYEVGKKGDANYYKDKSYLINVYSNSLGLIITENSLITPCISEEMLAMKPELITVSGSRKIKGDSAGIEMISKKVVQAILRQVLFDKIKIHLTSLSPNYKFLPVPKGLKITCFGILATNEFEGYTLIEEREGSALNYKHATIDNLGTSDCLSNHLFVLKYLSLFKENFISEHCRLYYNQLANSILIIYNPVREIPVRRLVMKWASDLTLVDCGTCYEQIHRQNTLPFSDHGSICSACAIETHKAHVSMNGIQPFIQCIAGCHERENVLVRMYKSGFYIHRMDRLIKMVDAETSETIRAFDYFNYLITEVYPRWLEMVEAQPVPSPTDDSIRLLKEMVSNQYQDVIRLSNALLEGDEQLSAEFTFAREALVRLVRLVRNDSTELEAITDKDEIFAHVQNSGDIIRMIGRAYVRTEANSPYHFDIVGVLMNVSYNSPFIPRMQAIFNILESLRCLTLCEHCKTIVVKNEGILNACDTGTCSACGKCVCLEHGTILSEKKYKCGYEHTATRNLEPNPPIIETKCDAYYHTVARQFVASDAPPRDIGTKCSCIVFTS